MTTISDERLAEMIIAAYRRGHAWCLENPGSEEYLAKAAYDYADKALSSLEASPAPVSEQWEAMDMIEQRFPGAFWILAKGRVKSEEPLYAIQILFGTDEVLAEGEGNSVAEAMRAALAAQGGQ